MRKYLIITGYEEIDEVRVPIFSSIELLTRGDDDALFIADIYYDLFELCELVDHIPAKFLSYSLEEKDPSNYNLN